MRIVVLDGYTLNPGDNPWDGLAALGPFEAHDRTEPAEVVDRLGDAEIAVINKVILDESTFAVLPRLRMVAVTATGVNVVDLASAARHGVVVSNVPTYGTESVAQFTLALLLELASRVGEHDRAVREGAWASSPDFSFWRTTPVELSGRTLGIVGMGAIGSRVGALASALGMSILAASRPGGKRQTPDYEPFSWCDLGELFERSDVVSLHCPLTDDNERFVDAALLARMKTGAWLINTARGGLVDEGALARALEEGWLAGAAVDVVSKEPVDPGNPLLHAPRCIVTPHMAWATLAARRRLMQTTVANVQAFLAGRPINMVGP